MNRPEHIVEIKMTEALQAAVDLGNEVNAFKAQLEGKGPLFPILSRAFGISLEEGRTRTRITFRTIDLARFLGRENQCFGDDW